MSGSNPPSTSGSPRPARRALLTSATALCALLAPVGLVVGTASGPAAQAETVIDTTSTSVTASARLGARGASAATLFRSKDAVATTTTTAAPPPVAPTTTTTAPPPPPPPPAPAPAPVSANGDPNDPASWDRLAQCESGGSWAANTGNGYYGGIQFSLSSWQAVGGTGYPHEHSRETQIEMGKRLYAQGGWSHWPSCSASFGWT